MGKVPKPQMTKITGIPSGNHGPARNASVIDHFTSHHIVGDATAAIAEIRKASRQMSFSFAVGSDGRIYEGTGIHVMPYSDGNWRSNQTTVSTEHAGGHPNVPYTEAMYQGTIKLHAWLIDQLGNKPFKRHRDVSDSPTACPGGLDVERIAREAKKLRDSYYQEDQPVKPTKNDIDNAFNFLGVPDTTMVPEKDYNYYGSRRENVLYVNVLKALYGKWDKLRKALAETNKKLAEASAKAALSDSLQKKLDEQIKKNEELLARQNAAEATGRSFLQWIGDLFNAGRK